MTEGKMTDEQFIEQLRQYLGEGAVVPVFKEADGSINREKTLGLVCFADFKLSE